MTQHTSCTPKSVVMSGDTKVAPCRGHCLIQTSLGEDGKPDTYGKDSESKCTESCALVKCPFNRRCKTSLPQWVLDTHEGLCMNCAMMLEEAWSARAFAESKVMHYTISTSKGVLAISMDGDKLMVPDETTTTLRTMYSFADYEIRTNEHGMFLIIDLNDPHDGQPEHLMSQAE